MSAIAVEGDHLCVIASDWHNDCEMVLFAVGVQPNVALGEHIGVRLGQGGALQVDRQMRTAVPDIFVAGDCGETWHRMLQRNIYLPLGTTSHKRLRVSESRDTEMDIVVVAPIDFNESDSGGARS